MDNLKIFTGNTNPEFAKKVAEHAGVELGHCKFGRFAPAFAPPGRRSLPAAPSVRGIAASRRPNRFQKGRCAEVGLPCTPTYQLSTERVTRLLPSSFPSAKMAARWRSRRGENQLRESINSTASRNASQLASMILSLTPTVPQMPRASPLSINTRVREPAPRLLSRMRTL